MNEAVRPIVEELKSGLAGSYGQRLRGVYVYGSYARGQQGSGSDLDVLIVLDRIDSYGSELDRTSELASDVSLKFGVTVSRVFVSERDWIHSEHPFLASVREDAIAA